MRRNKIGFHDPTACPRATLEIHNMHTATVTILVITCYACLSVATASWTHKYASLASGLEMHYVEAGDPSNPTVVLLHGFPDIWYVLDRGGPEERKIDSGYPEI